MVRKKRQTKITKVNRPPLSKKAKAAITEYVYLKNKKGYLTVDSTIDLTLKADRMPREKLYSYLKYRGYRWFTSYGYWSK